MNETGSETLLVETTYVVVVNSWLSACKKYVLLPNEDIRYHGRWYGNRWKPEESWLQFDVCEVVTAPGVYIT